MVCVKDQMVSELHHVVVDSAVDNKIISAPKAKQVAYEIARKMNEESLVGSFKVAFVKRDGSLILK